MTNRPKEKIFDALSEVYAPDKKDRGWWGGSDRNSMVHVCTVEVLDKIAEAYFEPNEAKREYLLRTLDNEIRTTIWMMFPGGTTAEYAAKKVMEALHS
jgi:ABC-type cobalt transport system substrate-binding protein